MADLLQAARVRQSCSGSGANNVSLLAPISSFQGFADAFAVGSKVTYCIQDGDGVKWEIGRGTLVSSTELSRDYIFSSSASSGYQNSGNPAERTKINLSANTHQVFNTIPPELFLFLNDTGAVSDPTPLRKSIFLPTMAAMVAEPVPATGEVVTVLGGSVLGDGGGGVFRWDGTDATAADNVDTFRNANSGTGLYKRTLLNLPQFQTANAELTKAVAVWTDVASASTTAIGAAGSQRLRITGTTTITAFDVAANGVKRTLRFADAVTLTHNGTSLILPGGDNITTAAGEVATFESLGSGNWVCTGYQENISKLTAAKTSGLSATATAGSTKTLAQWMAIVERLDADALTPEDFGAKGDGIIIQSGAAITAGQNTMNYAGGNFTAADVGKLIVIQGAAAAGAALFSYIAAVNSLTQVVIAILASTTVTNAEFSYATDDTAAFDAMEAARVARPTGASVVLRPVVYGLRNIKIISRLNSLPGADGWFGTGGTTTLLCMGPIDSSYFMAGDRWIDGSAWPGFSNSPMKFFNLLWHGNNLVDWCEVFKGYGWQHAPNCQYRGFRVGAVKLTRQNQFNDVITITGNTTSGSPTITAATFVSSTGAALSLTDIRVGQMIDGPGHVASGTNRPYIIAKNPGAGTLTISQNATTTQTGGTYKINRNGCGNGYQSENGWDKPIFRPSRTCTYLFKNEGTVENPGDASTDGWMTDPTIDGNGQADYGFYFGNMGGWHMTGVHAYNSVLWDWYVYELGYNHRIEDNQFEDKCFIGKVGPKNVLGTGNLFWEGLTVGFTNDTSTEELLVRDPDFTQFRGGGAFAQFTMDTAQPNKTTKLLNPSFRAGITANATAPIVRTNAGTIYVVGGNDGDGSMGFQLWDDGAAGVVDDQYHVSASPAVNDAAYTKRVFGRDSVGGKVLLGSFDIINQDATTGSVDASWRFFAKVNGVDTLKLTLGSTILSPVAFQSQTAGGAGVGVFSTGEGSVGVTLTRFSGDGSPPVYYGGKARGTIASPSSVVQFDTLLRIIAEGYGGGAMRAAGRVDFVVRAATPSSTDMETSRDTYLSGPGSVSPVISSSERVSVGLMIGGTSSSECVIDAARGIRLRSYTDAELNSIANAVNTTLKAIKEVWNSTQGRPVWASGSTAGAVWKFADGTTSNTPV